MPSRAYDAVNGVVHPISARVGDHLVLVAGDALRAGLQKRLLPEIDRHGGGGCEKRNDNEREHVQCGNPAEPVNARKRFDGVYSMRSKRYFYSTCIVDDISDFRGRVTIFNGE